MKVVITGGADVAPPQPPIAPDNRLKLVAGDIADAATVRALIDKGTGTVFHLAAVVSGEAEADTDIGYRVNLDGTRAVLEACRALGTQPRLVFASSLAVYGGDMPPVVADDTPLAPQTSYGNQRRSASSWSTITAARASSMVARCGFRPSSYVRAGPIALPRLGAPRSSASP